MNSLSGLVPGLAELCHKASEQILRVYQDPENFDIQHKKDESPVTAADMASNEILLAGLAELTPDIPVLSEERVQPWEVRQHWNKYWLVDPLDGTKEFIARNDEFCIAIALMTGSNPQLGFIYQPVTGDYYWGSSELGAYYQHQALRCSPVFSPVRTIGSRRSKSEGKWRQRLEDEGYEIEKVTQGSALKFCRIAEGEADLYPRMGPTCEWDIAAGQAILEGSGGRVIGVDGKAMKYNKQSLLNPHFFALGDPSLIPMVVDSE